MDRELVQTGVYKYYQNSLYDFYEGCSDDILVEEVETSFDELTYEHVLKSIPESIRYLDQYRDFSDMLAKLSSTIINYSGKIDRSYDLYNNDKEITLLISTLYDIEYPIDYKVEWMVLLNKYYMSIRRLRGTEESIKLLLLLLERSETELYEDYDYDNTKVIEVSTGEYIVTNPRIQNVEFTNYMLAKITEAGTKCRFVKEGDEDV